MSLLLRFAGLLLLWLAMGGISAANLVVGAAASLFAAWLSVRLLPAAGPPRPLAVARLVLHVAWQSVPAGIDVMARVFARDMRLHPGLRAVPTHLPLGRGRAGFNILSSLLPGTVAVGAGDERTILLHCLDTRDDVAAQSAATEALFAEATGG